MAAGAPVPRGVDRAVTLAEAEQLFAGLGPRGAMMIKAVAGGSGRGTRAVFAGDEIARTYERCRSEALSGFGREDPYLEELLPHARHVEIQILGDAAGAVVGPVLLAPTRRTSAGSLAPRGRPRGPPASPFADPSPHAEAQLDPRLSSLRPNLAPWRHPTPRRSMATEPAGTGEWPRSSRGPPERPNRRGP